jgi:hypothetical protein
VPYVDNNQSSKPKIVGYRKGDVWYDPFGKEISDPTVLSAYYANGLPIEPWLVTRIDSLNGIKGKNFNPNNSFEDFKPQVAISPRIQFSFPISNNSLFYGNYDVVTQNPSNLMVVHLILQHQMIIISYKKDKMIYQTQI